EGDTVVELGGATDSYFMRLTKRPTADVTVVALTDGTTDVVAIDGVAMDPTQYVEVGIYREALMFDGFIDVESSGTLLRRGNGSDLGNYFLEGFAVGQLVRVEIDGTVTDAKITALTVKTMTLDTALTVPDADGYDDVLIS